MSRIYQGTGTLTSDERTDLALYDAVIGNNLRDVRNIVQHTKRNLSDTFLVVRRKIYESLSPVHLVSHCGSAVVLKYMIETGCDVNKLGEDLKRTPVHIAVLGNNISCLQLLITAQAKLDAHDLFGNTPCHYAAEQGFLDILDMMIRLGAHVNCQDIAAKTALMKAVRNNRVESTLRLIRANADLNILDKNNEIALHFAVRNGNTELLDTLLSSGSLVDVQSSWGRTPLIEAVYANNTVIIQRLLAAGCNVDKRVIKTRETALHLAIRKKYIHVVEILLEHILSSPTHTIRMLSTYDLDISKYTCLLDDGNNRRATLFHMAAEKHFFQTCHLLALLGHTVSSYRLQFQASVENLELSEMDAQSVLSILDIMNTTIPLKQLCRNVIRCSIGNDLPKRVATLPVPVLIINYLLLKEEYSKFMANKRI